MEGILGTLAGTLIGFLISIFTERLHRLRAFRQGMAVLQAKLEKDSPDERVFFASSRQEVLVACARISSDIWCFKRARFRAARDDFCDVENREAQRALDNFEKRFLGDRPETLPQSKDTRSQREKMTAALQELIECATLWPWQRPCKSSLAGFCARSAEL